MLNRILWGVLVVLVAAITVPKALPQAEQKDDGWTVLYQEIPLARPIMAVTACLKDRTIVVTYTTGLSHVAREVYLAHERVHVRQAQRHANCEAWVKSRTPDSEYETELEAYCAQFKHMVWLGVDIGHHIDDAIRTLVEHAYAKKSAAEIRTELNFCLR